MLKTELPECERRKVLSHRQNVSLEGSVSGHVAQQGGIGGLRQNSLKGDLLIGHRGVLGWSELRVATQFYPEHIAVAAAVYTRERLGLVCSG